MEIKLLNQKYELIKNYKDAFNIEELKARYEDYFEKYDYILGDYAYAKLRLKGFYNDNNKDVTNINNYKQIDRYITDFCAFDCKYFIIKKK